MLAKHHFIPMLLGLFLAACGSDEDDTSLSNPVEYSGLESEAVITQTNAVDFVEEMFGTRGINFIPLAEVENFTPRPYNIEVPRAMTAAIQQIAFDTTTLSIIDIRLIGVSECDSGYMEYTITIDDLTNLFDGEIRFRECVSMSVELDGMAEVSGTFNSVNNSFTEITLSFALLSASDIYMSYEASGDIDIEFDEFGSITRLLNYAVKYAGIELTVKFDNYLIDETDGVQPQLTLAGRFYHPAHGFGTVTTNLIDVSTEDLAWPYSGSSIIAGTKSSLEVTFDYSDTYTLWVDVDGVPPPDFTTTLTW